MVRRILLVAVLALGGTLALPVDKTAAQKSSFIRDAETERIIRLYATPLFEAANLEPTAIRIFLINDRALNAFVAGGLNLFINTGLIMRARTPGELIGVIAHETGHMSGGHLSRIPGAARNAAAHTILGYILGGVAAIGGRPDVGAAVVAGQQGVAQRSFLQFSRTQENAADQAAVRLLDATGQSARGLLRFMDVLRGQEALSTASQDPYVRTHPLSSDRISFLEDHVRKSPYSDVPANPDLVKLHNRMRAKLIAFIEPPPRTFRAFPDSDRSVVARYARSIAHYRGASIEQALNGISGLIAEFPEDGYFRELKGQILFESGRAQEALPYYEEAIRLVPDSALLRADIGRVQVSTQDPALLDPAIENLSASLSREPNRASVWRQLGIAYGRKGERGRMSHALAEQALLQRSYSNAKRLADRAINLLPAGSPAWIRAQDVLSAAETGLVRQRRNR